MKWVGGKKRLLPRILGHYDGQSRVVEPFFGGGAVSFAVAAGNPAVEVFANDKIVELVDIYRAVRADVDAFIAGVDRFAGPYLAEHGKDARRKFFYEVRQAYMERQIDGPEPLFFLLWCAYSGLYRTGKEFPGRFNTSHGFGLEKPGFYKPERLRAAAEVMGSWTFTSGDFAALASRVTADSFVFLDPPYRETYTGYTADGFGAADQERVVEFALEAARRGATVVYTNKHLGDDWYDERFVPAGFTVELVPIRYQVNRDCATAGRPETLEVLISNARR